jgi:hypothetical protein
MINRLSKALFAVFVLSPAIANATAATPGHPGRVTIELSGTGWTLWPDTKAEWQNDELFLPPVDLKEIPQNAPTGGWQALSGSGMPVAVPGTAEEYLGNGSGPSTAVKGVTWWTRTIHVPSDIAGRKVRLQFDSARLRAEIYLNRKLVGYDVVGNTPFEADLTGFLSPGADAQIAVRITNPGGNFDWRDVDAFTWGKYKIPLSHGFGGITGGVRLVITDPIYLDDLYVQNTPVKTTVNINATVQNASERQTSAEEDIVIRDKATGAVAARERIPNLELKPGANTLHSSLSVPNAKVWDLKSPNLYTCSVSLSAAGGEKDEMARTFGFRWFAPDGIGSNAILRLNGQRVVLRTAISWGFWPVTGLFPSPALAEKQIRAAQAYGLNMLNFHRCIGNPIVLDKADELGLLYFEEPGGYVSGGTDAFAQALCREKLLRMVKRDRSHPSLVIYNMINEQWDKFGAGKDESLYSIHRRDLQDAHALDPSRMLLYTSSWAGRYGTADNDKAKMNMRPFDNVVHMNGWWDFHRAGGPNTWNQGFYRGPEDHYGLTKDRTEIVYWGEEGAVSGPPRLALIKKAIDSAPLKGWDSQVYLDWYNAFDQFLTSQNLRGSFPSVDELCKAMGTVSVEHQGRKIEDTRICDLNDGYAINGWESELIENHSGIVDCYRNPKADPGILAYYNQPLYVAVKPRSQIVAFPGSVLVDFYVINEGRLKGPHTVQVVATGADGRQTFTKEYPVTLQGGDVFSQLAADGVSIPLTSSAGMTSIRATLVDPQGGVKATGHDQVYAAEWRKTPISSSGAVFETGSSIRGFLKQNLGLDVPAFDNSVGKVDWIVVARSALGDPVPVPAEAFGAGLNTSFYQGEDFSKPIYHRTDASINFQINGGSAPDPHVPLTEQYAVRWEGQINPPANGDYNFVLNYANGARISINGRQCVNDWKAGRPRMHQFKIKLAAGKPVPIHVELLQTGGPAMMTLLWKTPIPEKVLPAQVLERASRDGTTIVLLDRADTWLEALSGATGIPQGKSFVLGNDWLGGQYFVKAHPLFAGLPVNQALNWPYQAVVGGARMALHLNGGELVAGAWHSYPLELGAAVSILPLGKGRIIVSTLDIASQLANTDSAAEVARKLFCNFLLFAGSI